jgi:hypothetical protein
MGFNHLSTTCLETRGVLLAPVGQRYGAEPAAANKEKKPTTE